MSQATQKLDKWVDSDYTHGFVTEIESDTLPPGLDEQVIETISAPKHEPDWLLQ